MYEFGMFMLRVFARALGVALGVLIVFIFAAAANASSQKYADLGGEPARLIFACEDKDAFDLAVAGLERSNSAGVADPYFKNGTCVLMEGEPVSPGELIVADTTVRSYATIDSKENRVLAYRISLGDGEILWFAVWISKDYGQLS